MAIVAPGVSPQYIIDRCKTLQTNWSVRAKKLKDWYEILILADELEQEGVESVVSNDPRTGYNLAKHLMSTMVIADKIPSDELPLENVPGISYLEKYISERWIDQEKRYRSVGRQSWLGEFVGWLLTTGWYSVFAMVTDKELWAEVWSPADSFPGFGSDGLVEHAHIYKLSPIAAMKKVKTMGWTIKKSITADITVYDLWTFDSDGDVSNSIVFESEFVKQPVKDIPSTKVGRLPVFTSPAGGLPDMGSIKGKGLWQQHYGESIVATNEDLTLQYNKIRSFIQHAARNIAQPTYLELSSGDTVIATDELMDRWGAVLHGQPGESVTPLNKGSIPVELTNMLFNYRNELERGMFPAAVHGNIQQQMSYLAMANMASAAMNVLTPYINACEGMRTDVDNFWTDMCIENGFNPHRFKKPSNLPDREDRLFTVTADVEIPGYMVQRATIARMLNPGFRLPQEWLIAKIFPEIRNRIKSLADVRAEDAMMDPDAIKVDAIIGYKQQAKFLREAGDIDSAELYEKLAAKKEAELTGQPAQSQPGQQVDAGQQIAEQSIAREAFPTREATTPIEGLGSTL